MITQDDNDECLMCVTRMAGEAKFIMMIMIVIIDDDDPFVHYHHHDHPCLSS